jgi:hypothetical protein
MKTFLLILTAISILASCHQKPKKLTKSLIIGDPLECGISNTLLFPVGTGFSHVENRNDQKTENSISRKGLLYFSENKTVLNDGRAQVEWVNDNLNDFDIRNILFYNLITGASYPLSKDTFHILSFAIHTEFTKPLIFYRIVKNDINQDSLYNAQDPVMLYVSNLSGDTIRQITSENHQFVDYFYYPTAKKILIKTVIDSDNNKEFEINDETNFVEMSIIKPEYGKEVFSKNLKDSLKNQILGN